MTNWRIIRYGWTDPNNRKASLLKNTFYNRIEFWRKNYKYHLHNLYITCFPINVNVLWLPNIYYDIKYYLVLILNNWGSNKIFFYQRCISTIDRIYLSVIFSYCCFLISIQFLSLVRNYLIQKYNLLPCA